MSTSARFTIDDFGVGPSVIPIFDATTSDLATAIMETLFSTEPHSISYTGESSEEQSSILDGALAGPPYCPNAYQIVVADDSAMHDEPIHTSSPWPGTFLLPLFLHYILF